ncbi:FAD-dependent oxidoreductase [Planotetraspora sp. A-T 1434]|uniref:FAD-dependent oxidoreductase n=1 Tax=Planotetraspora sp. A-T 1434 TaxID=2979219 RepID=UPI0021BE5B23|nr:FAD-dependent oxidoreductase [Planotetraspora sp. A-T 1434]MCT9929602.1 FAD-dependent oxidoreductase [Planotetraspora sp. A-T 1434]
MAERNRLPSTADVLIVGAGPVGLTLAASLVAEGVDVVLLDKQAEGANTSRAAVVHARTLEVLRDLGVTDELVRHGVVVPRFTVRDRDRTLMSIDFTELPTDYPFTLMVPQNVTEKVLLDRLHALGGQVHRPHEVTAVAQDAGGVTVTTATGETVSAAYVVGTDGMHSTVREQTGIGFTGDTYAESFVLADVHLDWDLPGDEVVLFFAPAGLAVVAPLPGGRHRVVATTDEAPDHPGRDDVQAILDARGPGERPAQVRDVVWSSRFRVHHRLADHYRAGRLLLAGDSAHVHSPAGGQGMNTGIQDAVALAARLTAVVRDGAPETELDRYEAERRPVAAEVVALTHRMTRLATLGRGPLQKVRNAVLRTLDWLPVVERTVAMTLSELMTDPERRARR